MTNSVGLVVLVMAAGNRRRLGLDPDRPRPAAAGIGLYADTVDGWLLTAGRRARSVGRAAKEAAVRVGGGPR